MLRMTDEQFSAYRNRSAPKQDTPTRSKYGAVRTEADGHKFDSKGEAARWMQLVAMQAAGVITDLRRQVKYPLIIRGAYGQVERAYVADYVYTQDGREVVEDFKGHRTREYILKRELMRALNGIAILETGSKT